MSQITVTPEAISQRKIPLKVSLDLDLLRGMAAILVVLSHWRWIFFQDLGQLHDPTAAVRTLYFLTDLGREAVIVFFVLSGYLVGGSVIRAYERGDWSWKSYLTDRGTRLYIVLIPALILGAMWDLWGSRQFGPVSPYTGFGDYGQMLAIKPLARAVTLPIFLGNIAFLQGIAVPNLGSNSALWSLANEFWYYISFPFLWIALAGKRPWLQRVLGIVIVALIMRAVGSKIAIQFPIWLLGALLAWRPLPGTLSSPIVRHVSSALFLSVVVAIHVIDHNNIWQVWPLGLATAFWMSCLIAQKETPVGNLRTKTSRGLSTISYTMYLVHKPLLFWLCASLALGGTRLLPTPSNLFQVSWVLPTIAIYTFVVWWLFESRTPALRRLLRSKPMGEGRAEPKPEPTSGKSPFLRQCRKAANLK